MKVPAIWFDFGAPVPRFAIAPPGVNAQTASDDALLLSLGINPAQVIQAGLIFVTTAAPVSISWPLVLPSIPFITMQTSYNLNEVRVPYHRRSSGATGISVVPTTTGATFSATTTNRQVAYVAISRSA